MVISFSPTGDHTGSIACASILSQQQSQILPSLPRELWGMVLSHCTSLDRHHAGSCSREIHALPEVSSVYSTFYLSSLSNRNDLKVMIYHTHDISTLHVNNYSFLEDLHLEFPCLTTLYVDSCSFTSFQFLSLMPQVKTIVFTRCNLPPFSSSTWISFPGLRSITVDHRLIYSSFSS